jgi:nicotinamidase-related amidase
MREWEKIMPDLDRRIYEQAGYGKPQNFGGKPALLIIDMILAFTGTKPRNSLEAVREFRTSCGKVAWQAIPAIRKLLHTSRERGFPIIYSTSDQYFIECFGNATKRAKESTTTRNVAMQFPEMIRPKKGEYIVRKARASAFFGTHLITYLTRKGVDTLFIAGCTTSGCVRATVLDGYSYGFSVFVVEECVFDRSRFSHLVNLYEMNSKYATVVTLDDALNWINRERNGFIAAVS